MGRGEGWGEGGREGWGQRSATLAHTKRTWFLAKSLLQNVLLLKIVYSSSTFLAMSLLDSTLALLKIGYSSKVFSSRIFTNVVVCHEPPARVHGRSRIVLIMVLRDAEAHTVGPTTGSKR